MLGSVFLMLVALCGLPQPASPVTPPAPQPATSPAATPAAQHSPSSAPKPEPPALDAIKTVDELLAALETADAQLRTLQADIMYDREFAVLGDRQIRQGRLYYQDDGPGAAPDAPRSRRFGIRTTTLQVGASIQDEVRDLVFDGRWLIERVPAEKQFIKRRIVADGQKFDPLRLGEGPFPLPIGQKRADILRKYVAKLLPAEQDVTANGETETDTERLKKFVAGSYQLQLTPRPELLESEELRDIRLWYRPSTPEPGAPATLLPRMARTVNRAQDVMLVQLVNVRLNQPVDATVLDTTPPTGDDWKIQED